MKPKYQHDCDNCVFLGQHSEYDLYYCPQGGHPTVIARYGNKGEEYTSGLSFAEKIEPLKIAKKLSIEKGLIK